VLDSATRTARLRVEPANLRCPQCGGGLAEAQGSLACASCGGMWEVRGGIPDFQGHGAYWGFAGQQKLKAINRLAEEQGWRAAAEEYARTQYPDRYEYHYDYIVSEARADFCVLADLGPGSRVLDTGSGWGGLTLSMARDAGEVYALDRTLEHLEFVSIRARQEGLPNVHPVGASALHLPFAEGFFDFIVMNGVLEWVGSGEGGASPTTLQGAALQQAWQKLKVGGQLYVGIENRWGIVYFVGRRDPHTGLRFVTLLPRWLADHYALALQGKPYCALTHSRAALLTLLQRAGFSQVDFYYPIPGYQNFRFMSRLDDEQSVEYLLGSLRTFPRMSRFLAFASRLALRAGALPLVRWTYPSLAAVASK